MGMKVKHYSNRQICERDRFIFSAPAEPVKNVDPDPQDNLVNLLLSPKDNLNTFTTAPKSLIKMLNSRHISKPAYLTIAGARRALLNHLVTGACIAACDPVFKEDHSCACTQLCSVYPRQQAMSFAVTGILVSTSQDRLPDVAIKIVADCRGWEDHARSAVLSTMSRALVHDHSTKSYRASLFEQLDSPPKVTLMSIAQVHGIFLKDATNDSLRQAITQHAGMRMCGS
jgi:hypothetical protein